MKKNSKFYCCVFVLFLDLSLSVHAYAQDINVEYATSQLKDNACFVDARITFDFDDEVLNALEHGVSLAINISLRLEQERDWLWDKLILETILNFELQYHPLSNNYLIVNLDSGHREQFQTLEEALIYLGTIKNFRFASKDDLVDKKKYRGLIKAELNIESLPPPLQTAAYVSSQWQLESQWYEWVIR